MLSGCVRIAVKMPSGGWVLWCPDGVRLRQDVTGWDQQNATIASGWRQGASGWRQAGVRVTRTLASGWRQVASGFVTMAPGDCHESIMMASGQRQACIEIASG